MTQDIGDLIHNLRSHDDQNDKFLMSACMNLYLEAVRRKGNRTHLGPEDMDKVFLMFSLLLEASRIEQDFTKIAAVVRRRTE